MNRHELYFVGSVPLANAEEVFRTLSAIAGPLLRWLPDGETGSGNWVMRFEPVFAQHPDFEPSDRLYSRVHEDRSNRQYRLRAGVDSSSVAFNDLPTVPIATASYALFARLKKAGVIPAHVKFQVTLAGINSVVRRFVVEEQHEAIAPRLEQGMIEQVRRLPLAIPPGELAVQFDIASAVFQYLETGRPTRFGQTSEEMVQTFAEMHAPLANAVPEGVDLLLHLCYGDANHRHSIEPASTKWLVAFAQALLARMRRRVDLIHMPVPRNRADDDYFAPLSTLQLPAETRLALGLVHYTDGVEGTRRRMATADRYRQDYLIATECGLGRRPAATVRPLLDIHVAAAG